jgi:hypothetical protein
MCKPAVRFCSLSPPSQHLASLRSAIILALAVHYLATDEDPASTQQRLHAISQTHTDTVTPNTLCPCIHLSDDKENITIFARPVRRLLSAYTRSCAHLAVHLISSVSFACVGRAQPWDRLAEAGSSSSSSVQPCAPMSQVACSFFFT